MSTKGKAQVTVYTTDGVQVTIGMVVYCLARWDFGGSNVWPYEVLAAGPKILRVKRIDRASEYRSQIAIAPQPFWAHERNAYEALGAKFEAKARTYYEQAHACTTAAHEAYKKADALACVCVAPDNTGGGANG